MSHPPHAPFLRAARYPAVAIFAAGILLVLILVNLFTVSEIRDARARVQQSHDFHNLLTQLRIALTDAETAERGFLLTGRPEYLEPLHSAEQMLPETLERARQASANMPDRIARLAELQGMATAKLGELHRTIALRQRGQEAAALAIVRTNAGKSIMDGVRLVIAALATSENERLAARSAASARYLRIAVWIDVLAGAGLLVLGYVLIAISRDIGQRVTLERALRQTAEFQQQFIGILGHDLRSPLTAIAITAETLQRQEPSSSQLQRIVASATRAGRLVDQLFDLAHVQLGKGMPIHPRPRTNLIEIVAAVTAELRLAHPKAQIRVHSAGSPVGVWDADRLAQLVSNLIGNAIEHGESPVEVAVREVNGGVLLEVHDAGVIAHEVLQTIFEPYDRSTRSPTKRSDGLGLGLLICREIARGHGGTIEAESLAASGTTFRVHLPRSRSSEP